MSDDRTVPRSVARALVQALCNYGGCKGRDAAARIAPDILAEQSAEDMRREAEDLRWRADQIDKARAAAKEGASQ